MRSVTSQEAGDEVIATARRRKEAPTDVWGYPYGMPSLDKMTGGIQFEPLKEMTVLIARPKVGKSLIAAGWVNDVATFFQREHEDLDVRVVLTEMSTAAYIRRMAAAAARVSPKALKQGRISDHELERFEEQVARIQGLPIHYLEGQPTLKQVESFITHEGKEGRRVGWWVVDHAGHLVGESENRTESLTRLSGGLMRLSHGIAPSLIVTHQKRRQPGQKTVDLEDIAGADAWGKDADNIFALMRADEDVEYDATAIQDAVPMVLQVLASREGEVGPVNLVMDRKHARIVDPNSKKKGKS